MEDIYPSDDHELASMCGTWQQLYFLKKKREEYKSGKAEVLKKDLSEMTRSERKLWYRNNIENVDAEKEQASNCSNYRQLLLMQGKGILKPDEMEDTRSRKLIWYRNGGMEERDSEKYLASQCSNWQQFYLLSRGPAHRQKLEEEIESDDIAEINAINYPTKSERLLWYRNGGEDIVGYHKWLASNSENWMQYKLTRDAGKHAYNLHQNVQKKYSDFQNKGEVAEYITSLRNEGIEEREEIRKSYRSSSLAESVTKEAYGYRVQPYSALELESEKKKSLETKFRIDSMQENLRLLTEDVMTARTEYTESARELAMKAIKADEEFVAASRMKRKTTVIQSSSQAATVSA